jgi:DNA polymerase epsilon subunit 2
MSSLQPPHPFKKPATTLPTRTAALQNDVLTKPHLDNPIPSSSPAFATPVPIINPRRAAPPIQPPNFKSPTVLPVLLPPATLRPLAFRTFTKKYNLTVSTSALAAFATFIGRHCGAGWKDDGLAEGVLEEAAKMWKKQSNAPIVDGDGDVLKSVLKTIESCMSGGRIISGRANMPKEIVC